MPEASLNLLVVRSGNLERALQFYGTLGLSFVKEQHGSGPIHYASHVGPIVFEIYPRDQDSSGAMHFGFRVSSVDNALIALQKQGVEVISSPKNTPWGRRALVKDPDGNGIEICE